MSDKLLTQAKEVVRLARKKGAQGVRASVHRSRESRVEWRDGKLDRLRESTRVGLGVTLLVDGRYSASSTSDLRPQALEKFLTEAVAMTRVLAPDKHRKLADPARYKKRHSGDLKLYDAAGIAAANAVERKRAVRELEAAARGAPGADKIVSVSSRCSDYLSESALVCSNGMEGTRRATAFVVSAVTYVKDTGHRKPVGWWFGVERQRSKLPSLASVGREATRRALLGVGSAPMTSGRYACVIENTTAARLLRWLLAPARGRHIQQKRSFLADKIGQRIASPELTITDSPLLVEGLSSRTYDGEGMATRKMPILERGVLKNHYLDTYYASKLGRAPTTGSFTNLVFSNGKKDLKALLAAMSTGLLVIGFSGGNSNPATGDFSIGIRGQWIERGQPVRSVSEMNLAGNHLTFWKQLRALGSDPFPYSAVRIPSLRFDKVQFSGK
jgi:PmbA protein